MESKIVLNRSKTLKTVNKVAFDDASTEVAIHQVAFRHELT
jgi:hypothetical protein